MDMLKNFFSYGCDPGLFEGLRIAEEKELCENYMGKFPVLSITLKVMDASDFEGAKAALSPLIGRAALCFSFLSKSEKLTGEQRVQYAQLIRNDAEGRQIFSISEEALKNLLSRALKSNDSIYFSVLTGCLRIAKESIFTGLNNFKVYSISDARFDEYFGFTEEEVKAMLDYYGPEKYESVIKEWFREEAGKDISRLDALCEAFARGDGREIF